MKAITICQPYAALILLPTSHPDHKFVENRTWPTSYRGPLLIHAGKSRSWLHGYVGGFNGLPHVDDLPFGAIVGVAELSRCDSIRDLMNICHGVTDASSKEKLAAKTIRAHKHTEGPFCWVLKNIRKFNTPIPYRGAQGLFDVPDEVVAEALEVANA